MRAATSMFLISLANILPRLASMTAFLCLVVAHLECPDIASLFVVRWSSPSTHGVLSGRGAAHQVHEQLVHPRVAAHLGMERRRQQRALPDRHDLTCGRPVPHAAEHLHALAG